MAYVVHAGDSRAYRLRNGNLLRLTTDHTVEQQLRERGVLSAPSLRYRNILVNHLGGDEVFPEPELAQVGLEIGDALLLATDGLTDALPDRDLASLASGGEPAEATCRKLVQAARERGSTDDATALLARFEPR
jgi:protein phosphatase